MKFLRNGDVNLFRVDRVEGKLIKKGTSFVLARGEATGSEHRLTVVSPESLFVYEDEKGTRYYQLLEEGEVTHTHDHEPLKIEPGIYRQVPEREVDHFGNSVVRKVLD